MKNAIVFGGAGFIGTHLLRSLAASGAYGRLVSVDMAPPADPVEGVDYRSHDIRKPIPDSIGGPDSTGGDFAEAYNLAAVHRTPGHEPHEYYETNVGGAIEVCDFARRTGIPAILFTSSIAVYGPGEDLKSETTPPTPTSDYGRSKLLAERVHREWQASDAARRLVVARPAVIFGKGENGNFTRLAGALRKGVFVYPGRKDTIKSCGYVGELVDTMAFTMGRDEPSILYNFCYPHAYTIEEICQSFERVAQLPKPRGLIPQGLMNGAALPFEVLDKVGLRNSINRERIAKLVLSTRVEPGYLNASGYRFGTDLDEAIRRWKADNVGDALV
ncbi:NAD(P)-dependent oxidoreductase [Aureimonas sp. AU12]|uniref:NAD-dependent epimerase/dehydratase family protein n=1 Tax=Aureimonas sp. AU12 TaxID=1638161 RepID=UPI0007832259|nr:NAD(P)-dependent oxidoreductase [Aureimonas sp. AU12]